MDLEHFLFAEHFSSLVFQIFIWAFKDNNLQGISFLDLHFYIHDLISIRNLALACDLYRSISLVRYQVCRRSYSFTVSFFDCYDCRLNRLAIMIFG